ncbi:S16 family serine protease [Paenibacillus periandrae]|uniref:S16 family serine protease n=1 Tax=Paenibacillus periandrae TaxID=1761741 RepID=UPI001F091862|nr:S16 family serine protease [Paenibacillus periandrae]
MKKIIKCSTFTLIFPFIPLCFMLSFEIIPFTYTVYSGSQATSLASEIKKPYIKKENHFYKLSTVGDGIVYANGFEVRQALNDYAKRQIPAIAMIHSVGFKEQDYSYPVETLFGKEGKSISQKNAAFVASAHLNIIIEDDEPFLTTAAGGSAGLMMALELIHQLGEKDLLRGQRICGTGTIAPDGQIGSVGGIALKVLAADRAECDYTFVPRNNENEYLNYLSTHPIKTHVVLINNYKEALDFITHL